MTDQEIVNVLKTNDLKGGTNALKILYKNNYYMVEDYILKNSGTRDDAKDIFQESVIVLYKNIKKESFELNGKISTYLYSITRNLWLKKLRDSKISTTSIDGYKDSFVQNSNAITAIEYSESQKLIGGMLQKASEKCKNLLKAFYYEKHSMKTIAATQGYSSEQVAKNQKVRCLKKLRTLLNSSEYYLGNLENSY